MFETLQMPRLSAGKQAAGLGQVCAEQTCAIEPARIERLGQLVGVV